MGRISLRDKHWQKRYQLRYAREDYNRTEGLEGLWTQGWGTKMTNQMPMKQMVEWVRFPILSPHLFSQCVHVRMIAGWLMSGL